MNTDDSSHTQVTFKVSYLINSRIAEKELQKQQNEREKPKATPESLKPLRGLDHQLLYRYYPEK